MAIDKKNEVMSALNRCRETISSRLLRFEDADQDLNLDEDYLKVKSLYFQRLKDYSIHLNANPNHGNSQDVKILTDFANKIEKSAKAEDFKNHFADLIKFVSNRLQA